MFCSDLDDNLREMGVGDLAVPKRMRASAKRSTAGRPPISPLLPLPMTRELEKALARNIFAGADSDGGAARLARYARAALRQFEVQEDGALLRGEVAFPKPETIASGCAEAPG